MLTIEPGVSGGEVAAGELAGAEERAVERDVDDGAPGVGRHVLGGHREVGGGVVDRARRAGRSSASARVERGGDLVGVADVAGDGEDPARRASPMRLRPGLEVLGLAAGDHDVGAEAGELGGDRLARGRCRRR